MTSRGLFFTIAGFFLAFLLGGALMYYLPQIRSAQIVDVQMLSPAPSAQASPAVAQTTPSPSPTPAGTPDTDTGVGGVIVPLTVLMNAQNNSGISGTATLQDLEGKTVVTIALTGATTGTRLPVHIHSGTCENLGPIRHTLESTLNGRSVTTINVGIDALSGQVPLAINAHQSATAMEENVACGALPDIRL